MQGLNNRNVAGNNCYYSQEEHCIPIIKRSTECSQASTRDIKDQKKGRYPATKTKKRITQLKIKIQITLEKQELFEDLIKKPINI